MSHFENYFAKSVWSPLQAQLPRQAASWTQVGLPAETAPFAVGSPRSAWLNIYVYSMFPNASHVFDAIFRWAVHLGQKSSEDISYKCLVQGPL